jgi:hypothetical protein
MKDFTDFPEQRKLCLVWPKGCPFISFQFSPRGALCVTSNVLGNAVAHVSPPSNPYHCLPQGSQVARVSAAQEQKRPEHGEVLSMRQGPEVEPRKSW